MTETKPPPAKAKAYSNGTALQKHVSYFDRSGTGIIYPWETYTSFRALGFHILIAIASVLAFHTLHVGYPTSESWIPDLRFPVYVDRIQRAKHGSDTGAYNRKGEFDERGWEGIWEFDRTKKGGLFFSEIVDMWIANRNVFDVVGWVFQVFLWSYLWLLAADGQGVLRKDDVRRQYDGSLYYEIEERRKRGERLPWYRGGALW